MILIDWRMNFQVLSTCSISLTFRWNYFWFSRNTLSFDVHLSDKFWRSSSVSWIYMHLFNLVLLISGKITYLKAKFQDMFWNLRQKFDFFDYLSWYSGPPSSVLFWDVSWKYSKDQVIPGMKPQPPTWKTYLILWAISLPNQMALC